MKSLCMECSSKMEGLFSSKQASQALVLELSQIFPIKEVICSKCVAKIASQEIVDRERSLLELNMAINIVTMEIAKDFIVSPSDAPVDAEMKGLVTGYSALGVGVFAGIASSITDTFGAQSESYQNKLKDSEDFARQNLIAKAIDLEATAIYDARLQITEATSATAGKGILLVCIFGSAIVGKEVPEAFLKRKEYVQAKQKLENEVIALKEIIEKFSL